MKNLKAYIYSPLLGGCISGLILWLYGIMLIVEELYRLPHQFLLSKLLINSFILFPSMMMVSIIVSYIIFFPLLWLTKKIKRKFALREGTGWAILFLLGLIIGSLISLNSYHFDHLIGKAILIPIIFSVGLMFNGSLFSILNNDLLKQSQK